MKFEVNIDKKFAFMILGAILILAGAIYGYAQGGSTPNPGHDWNEINSPDEANRWAKWSEIEGTIPEQATRWADWSEITGIPSGFADGIDNSGGSNTCRWVNDNSACDGGTDTISCASNEYVRKVRTNPSCYIGDSSYRTKVDLYCCDFS